MVFFTPYFMHISYVAQILHICHKNILSTGKLHGVYSLRAIPPCISAPQIAKPNLRQRRRGKLGVRDFLVSSCHLRFTPRPDRHTTLYSIKKVGCLEGMIM